MIETKVATAVSWGAGGFMMMLNTIENTDGTYYGAIAFLCTGNVCAAILGLGDK